MKVQEKQSKDSVAYDTYRRTLSEAKKAKAALAEKDAALQKLEQEKLEAEGNKDALIDSLRKQYQDAEKQLKESKDKFAYRSVSEQIKREAVAQGCKKPDVLMQLLSDEFVANIAASNKLAGALDQDKVVDMITQANTVRMPRTDRTFIFGNTSYGTLLKIDGFVDASKSNLDIVRNGQIGTLYGIPVVESDVVGAGESFLVHRRALAYAFGALPAVEDAPVIEFGTGSRRWVMDQLYGVKSLNQGNLVVSVGVV